MPAPPLSNSFEGGSDTTVITVGNSGGTSGDAFTSVDASPTFSVDHPAHGSLGVKIPDPAAQTGVRWSTLGVVTTEVWLRAYLWIPSIPTGAVYRPFSLLNNVGDVQGSVEILTTGKARAKPGAVVGVDGTVNVPTSAIFRVELRVLPGASSNGAVEVRWWSDPDSTGAATDTMLANNVTTGATANIDRSVFGSQNTFPTTPYTTYVDDLAISTIGWIGPLQADVGRIFKRFYGPAQLTGSAADLYTVPTGKRIRVLDTHVSNPSASAVDLTLSIGTDAAGTRVYDGLSIAADSRKDDFTPYELAAGEKIQGFASSAATLNLTITGYEEDV